MATKKKNTNTPAKGKKAAPKAAPTKTSTAKAEATKAREREVRAGLDRWVGLLATDENGVASLGKVKSVNTGNANIAGVAIPTFESIETEVKAVDAWSTPAWVDSAVETTTQGLGSPPPWNRL